MKRILCWLFKHKFVLTQKLPNLGSDMFCLHGTIDYKCSRCGKVQTGFFYIDRFRIMSWHRILSEQETDMIEKNPYIFLKQR